MRRPPEQSPDDIDAMWRRGEQERAFWEAHYETLKHLYPDELVVVRDGQVIDHDPQLLPILERLDARGLDPRDVWMEFIADKVKFLL